MSTRRYIQVLLPIKLDWEPVYALPEGAEVQIGDRIIVEFARKKYSGIITSLDVTPPPGFDVKDAVVSSESSPVISSESSPVISSEVEKSQLTFWHLLSSYYLCTPGEVFKAASIPEKESKRQTKKKERKAAPVQLSLELEAAYSSIFSAFSNRKTVLLEAPAGSGKTEIYLRLAADVLSHGKSVLYLVPDIGLTKQLEEKVSAVFPDVLAYHSGRTVLARNRIAQETRSGEACFVLGTKNALFLPFKDLGLIIVDQEHDTSFKHESPAPRFNAREAAIMLAGVHGANVILGSETPSLESLYNSETGLFTRVQLKDNLKTGPAPGISIINTPAEMRKGGMSGEFSLKFLEEIKAAADAGLPVLVLRTQHYSPLIEDQLSSLYPIARIQVCGRRELRDIDLSGPGLCAIVHADIFLASADFRSDERALQLLRHLQGPDGNRRLVIQTRTPGHPVFKALRSGSDALVFLPERRQFNLPPFTRLVDIAISDTNPRRLNYLTKLLQEDLQALSLPAAVSSSLPAATGNLLRLALPRDRSLKSRKQAIYAAVKAFEKAHKYSGHIVIDVDPV